MAVEPQIGREGEVYSGIHTSGRIPQSILKGGMDELGKLVYMTKEMSKFAHFVHTRFSGKTKTVGTREHKVSQISELERFYTAQSTSTTVAGGLCQVAVRNYEANQIKVNDTLILAQTYVAPVVEGQVLASVTSSLASASNQTMYSPDMAGARLTDMKYSRSFGLDNGANLYFVDNEQVDVTAIGDADGAGTGLTYITLRRNWQGPTAIDRGGALIPPSIIDTAAAANTAGSQIQAGDTLHRALPSFFEGTDAPTGLFKSVEIDNNFTQEIKYAVEITNESDIEKTWLSEKPLDINRWLMTRRQNRDLEIQYIFGKKGKQEDSSGRMRYRMGGVLEFIPKDKDHYIKYNQSTLSWSNLLKMSKEIARLGGSEERYLFCGYSLDTALRAAFAENNLVINDPKLTKEFNVEVNSIMGAGVKINLVPSQIMEEMGWGFKGLCLDLDNPSFTPVSHAGYDMKVDKGPNGQGIQLPGMQIYKEQMIGIKGLERRYRDYHSVVDFTNIG